MKDVLNNTYYFRSYLYSIGKNLKYVIIKNTY